MYSILDLTCRFYDGEKTKETTAAAAAYGHQAVEYGAYWGDEMPSTPNTVDEALDAFDKYVGCFSAANDEDYKAEIILANPFWPTPSLYLYSKYLEMIE